MQRNIRLLLAYDGTAYHGWERQKDFPTLQQTLEDAIHSLMGEPAHVIASGRTDAGVHALGQVANFETSTRHDCATIVRALNALLPNELRVLQADEVDQSFHATYAAKGKLYRYCMHDGPVLDPFLRHYAWHCNWPLDDQAMDRAARCLLGTHDFSSFETAGAPRETSIRTISHIAAFRAGRGHLWSREPDDGLRPAGSSPLVFIEVAADGFLYNMVRAIAGTLVNVGRGYWPPDRVAEVLNATDRTRGGPTSPPHGLFLVRVEY